MDTGTTVHLVRLLKSPDESLKIKTKRRKASGLFPYMQKRKQARDVAGMTARQTIITLTSGSAVVTVPEKPKTTTI